MNLHSTEPLKPVVRTLVARLAKKEYEVLVDECSASRLTAKDIRSVILDYGCTFVEPPPETYSELDAIAVRDSEKPTWSIWVPLWSREEGRSDLTLQLTIIQNGDRWDVELDDLHVP